jgi:hypothetical protein
MCKAGTVTQERGMRDPRGAFTYRRACSTKTPSSISHPRGGQLCVSRILQQVHLSLASCRVMNLASWLLVLSILILSGRSHRLDGGGTAREDGTAAFLEHQRCREEG